VPASKNATTCGRGETSHGMLTTMLTNYSDLHALGVICQL